MTVTMAMRVVLIAALVILVYLLATSRIFLATPRCPGAPSGPPFKKMYRGAPTAFPTSPYFNIFVLEQ